MHSDEIERRLRLPAPDEPSFLPPLLLPQTTAGFDLTGRRVRAGSTGGSLRLVSPRLAIALVALLLALAAAMVTGALRLDRLFERLPKELSFTGDGVAFDIPDGWVQLTPDDPFNNSAAFTTLVVANRDVEGCAASEVPWVTRPPDIIVTPAPGASGDALYVEPPRDGPDYSGIEDQVFACIVDAPMTPGEVRIAVSFGAPQEIGVGPIEDFDPTAWFGPDAQLGDVPFKQLPAEETGWTEVIGEMPAKLVVTPGSDGDGPDEIRTWGVYDTQAFHDIWFIRASLRGPNLDELRARADGIARSMRFMRRPNVLDEARRDAALASAIDGLDREFRQSQGSRIIACFPRTPGEQTVVVEEGLAGPLLEPATVTCSTTLDETPLHLWRARLVMTWPAGDGWPAGSWGRELFFSGEEFTTAQAQIGDDRFLIFPGTTSPEAAPLEQPLELAPGTIVQVLAPGLRQTSRVVTESWDNPHETIRDRFVYEAQGGRRFTIVDGPISHIGAQWYLVEAPLGTSYPTVFQWLPVSDGNLQLIRVVEPRCPPEPTVADLMTLLPAERVRCFGGQDITLGPVTATRAEDFSDAPIEGDPAWLVAAPLRLYGEDGPKGVDGSLPVAVDPALPDELPTDVPLTVTGHFEDEAAANCAWREPSDWGRESPAQQQLRCSEIFVVTGIEGTE